MNKKLIPVVSALLTILSYLPQWGWTKMPEWVAPIARLLFWVFLSITVIFVLVIFWDKINNWIPVVRFEKRGRVKRPEDLILRQIIYINASPFISGSTESLDVGIIFPTFLPKKLEFAKIRGYITIDGHATEEQEFRPITLFDKSPNEIQLHVALTPNVSTKVRDQIKVNNKVEVSLHLTGWDVKNKRYDLSTRGWTTKFLT